MRAQPRHRWIGSAAAGLLIGAWVASLAWLLAVPEPLAWWTVPAVLARTWLSTGLFITAHDAMHGTVFPGNRSVNDRVGQLALLLYAVFPYRKLARMHRLHHAHPGRLGRDPDFHAGGPVRWYASFVRNYLGVWQIVAMALAFNLAHHLLGVAQTNLLLFWVAPALLSTVQLFVVGTWLPHREPHLLADPHRARSLRLPRPLSLLACYHFGYHREHHDRPWIPWWRLRPAD